ncbi:hypothetical protein Tco_0779424, partial [Tanacetum coccineum]
AIYHNKVVSEPGYDKQWQKMGRWYDRGQEAEQKQVEIMEDRRDKVQAEYHVLELQPEGPLSKLVGWSKFIKKAMALHLLHQSEDPATMILLSKTAAGVANGTVMLKMVPETPLQFGVAERLS